MSYSTVLNPLLLKIYPYKLKLLWIKGCWFSYQVWIFFTNIGRIFWTGEDYFSLNGGIITQNGCIWSTNNSNERTNLHDKKVIPWYVFTANFINWLCFLRSFYHSRIEKEHEGIFIHNFYVRLSISSYLLTSSRINNTITILLAPNKVLKNRKIFVPLIVVSILFKH